VEVVADKSALVSSPLSQLSDAIVVAHHIGPEILTLLIVKLLTTLQFA
jgi:hypothetical protein